MTKDELLKIRIQSAKWEIKACDAVIKEELDFIERENNAIEGLSKKEAIYECNAEIKKTLERIDVLNNQHTALTEKLTLLTEPPLPNVPPPPGVHSKLDNREQG